MALEDHLNHKPNAEGIATIERIKTAIINLDHAIEENLPSGREKSVALTKLEECRMWAVKGAVFANTEAVNEISE
jgi:hypothetical protein